jgi:hypothetical protein
VQNVHAQHSLRPSHQETSNTVQNVHTQHSVILSHQETANTVQNVHTQHSERPSHQENDSAIQNVYNILRELQVTGLMVLLKMCTKKHSERPSLQGADGIFLETEECEGRMSCIKIIMVFIQIWLLTVTQNKVKNNKNMKSLAVKFSFTV